MQLTKDQIQQIETYLSSCVEWYDVRMELIDHFAMAVSAELKENPIQSFKQALNQVHKNFGTNGFKDLLATKTKVVEKQFYKSAFKYFAGFFKLPRIILTGFSFWALVILLSNIENKENFFLTLSAIALFIAALLLYRSLKLSIKKGEKILVLNQARSYLHIIQSLYIILNSFTTFRHHNFSNDFANYLDLALYVLLTLFLISCEYVYYRLKKDIKNQFPNLKLAQ
ncbi:MAG: hypothetical protein QM486_00130 [Flavobacteriaceae bacterium]